MHGGVRGRRRKPPPTRSSFIGSKCKNVKLAQILSVTLIVLSGIFYLLGVEIGPFGIIWKWIGVCELL